MRLRGFCLLVLSLLVLPLLARNANADSISTADLLAIQDIPMLAERAGLTVHAGFRDIVAEHTKVSDIGKSNARDVGGSTFDFRTPSSSIILFDYSIDESKPNEHEKSVAVWEPSTLLLLGSGFVVLFGRRTRRESSRPAKGS